MRRHLVKKPSRTQGGRGSPGGLAPILRRKKKKKKLDRRPHEVQDPGVGHQLPLASAPRASPSLTSRRALALGPIRWPPGPHPWCLPQVFVELNELMLDRSQEPHWRETARWIKFEEDVEEETERWGKPHVASLSFRSLLELRRTIAHGRALQAWPWAACPLHRLQSLCQAAHLPRLLPGVLGPGTIWLPPWGCGVQLPAQLSAVRGGVLPLVPGTVPWHSRPPSLGEEGPCPHSVLRFHDHLSGWAMATWSSISAWGRGAWLPQRVCLPWGSKAAGAGFPYLIGPCPLL